MLEAHVGRWRGQSSNHLVGALLLSVAANKSLTLRLGNNQRLRLHGFPSERGQRIHLRFRGERADDELELELLQGAAGVLRSNLRGTLGGVPVSDSIRLHKR